MCATERPPNYGVESPDTSSHQVGRCPPSARATPCADRRQLRWKVQDFAAQRDAERLSGRESDGGGTHVVTQRDAATDISCHRERLLRRAPSRPETALSRGLMALDPRQGVLSSRAVPCGPIARALGLGRAPERDTILRRDSAVVGTVGSVIDAAPSVANHRFSVFAGGIPTRRRVPPRPTDSSE
jgi:hypothetical protein